MSLVSRTLSISLLVATVALLRAGPADENVEPTVVEGTPGAAAARAVVNFSDLARREPAQFTPVRKPLHPLMRRGRREPASSLSASASPTPAPSIASPSSTTNFLGLADNDTSIPPDTHGAVGTNHVMTVLNTQIRIQNRNGGVMSTVSLDSFWAGVGGTPSVFDPKVLYDPYNNRWMFTACADGELSTSALLIGVSQTGDPTGNWFLYKIDADAANVNWADYPSLGFNKNWIVVSVNLFPLSGSGFGGVDIYAFNKTNLYANGSGTFTKLQDHSGIGFTLAPAITCDNTSTTEYLLEDWDGTTGKLRMSRITGTPSAATLTLGTSFPTTSTWGSGFGDFLPQLGTTRTIDGGDSRIQNVVQRNGRLWATHSVYLSSPNRAAVQWWQVTTNGNVLQAARIDDLTGAKHFAYPTLAVNASNDVLIGYSRFGAGQFASANYSFRFGTDAINTLHDDTVLKAGEGTYIKTFGGEANRWGDYSSTVMDPVNDMSMWTVQEYAATPLNPATTDGNGRWGTWWGRFDIGVESASLISARLTGESCLPTNGVIDPGESVTIDFTVRNSGSVDISNLVATLQTGTGVSAPSGPQNYGQMLVGGADVTRSFTFIATGACGGAITARLQLQDGAVNLGTFTNTFPLGVLKVAFTENFDSILPPALPAGWTNFKSGAESLWVTTNLFSDTPMNSIFVPDPTLVGEAHITSPPIPITTANAQLTFRHRYDFENTYDGGVLEIAIGSGAFGDIITRGGSFITNGYTATINSGFNNPLAGRMAWSGPVTSFITTAVRLPAAAAGQNVRLRWRAGTDSSTTGDTSAPGWFVDTVSLLDGFTCCSGFVAPTIVNVRQVANNLAFSFVSAVGQSYHVEYKDSLNVSNWQTLQTIVGDGTVKTVTNATAATRFFRLSSP